MASCSQPPSTGNLCRCNRNPIDQSGSVGGADVAEEPARGRHVDPRAVGNPGYAGAQEVVEASVENDFRVDGRSAPVVVFGVAGRRLRRLGDRDGQARFRWTLEGVRSYLDGVREGRHER